jgi:hypothetical protein
MSKRITFQGTQIRFLQECVVCQKPASADYKITKTFTFGNRSVTITLPVPMCTEHYDLATRKNARERAVERIGLIAGGLIGIIVAVGLLTYWGSTGQGNTFMNVFLAIVLGLGFFLIVWVTTAFWLAPAFGDPQSKVARNAVKIYHFKPGSQELTLEFANEPVADAAGRVNQNILVG